MARWRILLTFSLAFVALGQSLEGDSVILTARGQARYAKKSHLERKAIHKGTVDQPAMIEDRAELTPTPEPLTAFVQSVNGSTPTGWLELGTPPKWLFVIFDTGSDKGVFKTWDTLQHEFDNLEPGEPNDVLPSPLLYNSNTSSTYERTYMTDPTTNAQVPMQDHIMYGSGLAITDEGRDTVALGHFQLENFSISEITEDQLALLHTKDGVSGVLGLQHMKNRTLGHSFFSAMRDAGRFSSFGYCRGLGDNGTFIWGDQSTEGVEIDVIGQMHWAVTLGRMAVNGHGAGTAASDEDEPVLTRSGSFINRHLFGKTGSAANGRGPNDTDDSDDSDDSGDSDGSDDDSNVPAPAPTPIPCLGTSCVAILDTGSNIIAGPTDFMTALSNQMNVAIDCSNYDSLPTMTIEFGGQNLTVHPEGYVMKVPMPPLAGLAGGDGDGDGDGFVGDGDGDGGGFHAQQGFHDFSRDGGSHQQGRKQHRSIAGWNEVFEQLRIHRGIDLSAALSGAKRSHSTTSRRRRRRRKTSSENATNSSENASNASEAGTETASLPAFMCMPALVPLDKLTAQGPLFVVGTPLLQTHYARWSWPQGDDAPKIHIKRLSETNVCQTATPTNLNPPGGAFFDEAVKPVVTPRLVRSESRATSSLSPRKRGPIVRNIEDIRFPHWAMLLKENSAL